MARYYERRSTTAWLLSRLLLGMVLFLPGLAVMTVGIGDVVRNPAAVTAFVLAVGACLANPR